MHERLEEQEKLNEESLEHFSSIDENIKEVADKITELVEKKPFVIEEKKIEFPSFENIKAVIEDKQVEVTNLKDIVIPQVKFPEIQKIQSIDEEASEVNIAYGIDDEISRITYVYTSKTLTQTFVRDSSGRITGVRTKENAK